MFFDEPAQKRNVVIPCVKRGNVVQLTATGITEQLVILYGDFLERFETVG